MSGYLPLAGLIPVMHGVINVTQEAREREFDIFACAFLNYLIWPEWWKMESCAFWLIMWHCRGDTQIVMVSSISSRILKLNVVAKTMKPRFLIHYSVEPQFNKGPTGWQNSFALTRFFFIYVTIIGVKKIVRYIENFVIQKFLYRGSTVVTKYNDKH